ncbi:N-acetylglucosamine-6-phosphate deacetylase [Oceaniglobus ichthyenteri]|uniref:N-acetylglucosamine-6-phosphate deacetylase n=1 Tax=Oceaniglobus ichthyenteri TaxID=2136177 RepID=UPI000D349B5B|nr:amidohydrolase family protein [Oceaniglobus ichthyenteri]
MQWILPRAVYDGETFLSDVAVAFENDILVARRHISALPAEVAPKPVPEILSPGLFDVQVNGGGGVMLNNDPTPQGVRAIAAAHRSVGTAFVLPTVITDHPDVTERAADAVLAEHGRGGVLGIHIEGPHINVARKGTHDPARIRPFDAQTRALLARLREHDLPVLFTVAPETLPPGTIADLTRMGVTVAAGHTTATALQGEQALAEGLRGFTHLFNAMPPMTSRAPGIAGVAINSTAYCGIIADGHHVDDRMVALAFRARPCAGRMVLVSDAMSTIAGPDRFELYGETIRVENGKLVNANGALAGAHIDLKTSVARLVADVGISPVEALRAATVTPRDLMKLPRQPLLGSHRDTLYFGKLQRHGA